MKRILCVCLLTILLVNCGGCAPVIGALDAVYGDEEVAKAEAAPRIGFSTGTLLEDESEVILEADEVAAKQVASSVYRGQVGFDALADEEKIVYHAYEYAMENGYTNILIDDLLVPDVETLYKILEYLALDSPLLEQNLRYKVGNFTTYYPVDVLGVYKRQATFDGYYIIVDNFDAKWWEKKQQAIEKAVEIVETLPAEMSDAQKAEKLYRYIAKNITYAEYGEDAEKEVLPYLYDALITGKTHCDGYTNAFSLLCRLAGINCVEKMCTAKKGGIGHTWNCLELDGVWYNADVTGSTMIPKKSSKMHAGCYFAFGDVLQEFIPNYAHIYPDCPDGLYMPVDAHLTKFSSEKFVDAVCQAFNEHDDEWALLVIDSCSKSKIGSQMQRVANRLQCTVSWQSWNVIDDRTAVLVCREELYK